MSGRPAQAPEPTEVEPAPEQLTTCEVIEVIENVLQSQPEGGSAGPAPGDKQEASEGCPTSEGSPGVPAPGSTSSDWEHGEAEASWAAQGWDLELFDSSSRASRDNGWQ